jgi:hypothetical protein
MNTKTIQLPIKREHRRMATIFTLAAILGVVLAITDIHREIARVIWPLITNIHDALGLPIY